MQLILQPSRVRCCRNSVCRLRSAVEKSGLSGVDEALYTIALTNNDRVLDIAMSKTGSAATSRDTCRASANDGRLFVRDGQREGCGEAGEYERISPQEGEGGHQGIEFPRIIAGDYWATSMPQQPGTAGRLLRMPSTAWMCTGRAWRWSLCW